MNMAHFSGEKGQSLIEILIAFTLIVLGIGSATILVFGGQGLLIDRGNTVQARSRAQEGLLAVEQMIQNDWDSVSNGTYGIVFTDGTWQLSGESTVDDRYTRYVSVTSIDDNRKEITSSVVWETGGEGSRIVEFVTLVTNWQNVAPPSPDPGDTGGGGVSGNWQNPRTLGSVDLGPGNEASDLDVINKIVYMSATASSKNKPDFFIIDATDGENPVMISELNTGPSLNSIDASGSYAYVANDDVQAQLQVIDVSDINSPFITASLEVAADAGGTAIFFTNAKIYLGTYQNSADEFYIIDVSDPLNPSVLGSYEMNGTVRDIYVRDSRAYITVEREVDTVAILNVSTPSSIVSEGGEYIDEAYGIMSIRPALTFIGIDTDLVIADTVNAAAVATIGSIGIGGNVNDIAVRDYLVFIATSNNNKEFQTINVSDPSNPSVHSSFNFSQVGTGIDYEDNIVYISVRSNDALRIITSSP